MQSLSIGHTRHGPDEDYTFLADSRELGALRIEFAEPDLVFVPAQRRQTIGRDERRRAAVVLQKREAITLVDVVILALADLVVDALSQERLQPVGLEHRVPRQVGVQLLEQVLPHRRDLLLIDLSDRCFIFPALVTLAHLQWLHYHTR